LIQLFLMNLIADAGYGAKPYICTQYRQPLTEEPHNKHYNHLLFSARCIVEHLNGTLKGRFQSIKSLRILILNHDDFKTLNEWIMVCCNLHNIFNMLNDH
jgi:hypothetical protein